MPGTPKKGAREESHGLLFLRINRILVLRGGFLLLTVIYFHQNA
jgi:hypothetical protein